MAAQTAPPRTSPSMPTSPALEVSTDGLARAFGRGATARTVLHDVDLRVRAGEVVAILGASGCGKSTLLRLAAGLDAPTSGRVSVAGSPVAGLDPRCAVAFQEPRLLPWRTIADNVAVGLPRGTGSREGRLLVEELLALVGLAEFAQHRPREVSGGMAQRASLARALARRPGVLLLDEPFGALDALTRLKMQDLLIDVHDQAPTTVLLVTHDVDEALQLADRIVVLGSVPGLEGATITRVLDVPGTRPRSRSSAELGALRTSLLETLGVDSHDR